MNVTVKVTNEELEAIQLSQDSLEELITVKLQSSGDEIIDLNVVVDVKE